VIVATGTTMKNILHLYEIYNPDELKKIVTIWLYIIFSFAYY